MAVFTKINKRDMLEIEKNFNLGRIKNFHGIKKGIENTNYFIEFRKLKTILTILKKSEYRFTILYEVNVWFVKS